MRRVFLDGKQQLVYSTQPYLTKSAQVALHALLAHVLAVKERAQRIHAWNLIRRRRKHLSDAIHVEEALE